MDCALRWAPRLPMLLAPDPVWQLPRQPWSGGQSIVVSWRPTPLLDARGWSVLLNALATLAERIDAPVRWMAFHRHQDAPLLQQLIDQNLVPATLISRSTTVVPTTLETVFASVRTARLVIPMRLHALILARLACCPMAALSYDPKVEAAAAMAGIPCSTLGALPDLDGLLDQWQSQVDQPVDPHRIDQICPAGRHGRFQRHPPQRWHLASVVIETAINRPATVRPTGRSPPKLVPRMCRYFLIPQQERGIGKGWKSWRPNHCCSSGQNR